MKKHSSKHFRRVIFASTLIILISAIYLEKVRLKKESNELIHEMQAAQILWTAADYYRQLYQSGVKHLSLKERNQVNINCSGLYEKNPVVDDTYTECNPYFFQCYLQALDKDQFKKFSNSAIEFIPYKSGQFYQPIFRSKHLGEATPLSAIEVTLRLTKEKDFSQTFLFENNCHEVFLPERKYAFSEAYKKNTEKDIWHWDNHQRKILVDQYLVTNRDVLEWVSIEKDLFNEKFLVPTKDLGKTATSLTFTMMEQYCAFHGKKLLRAHVLQAASAYPEDIAITQPPYVINGPFHWTYKNEQPVINPCDRFYVQECVGKSPYLYHSNKTISWSAVAEVMGGIPEIVYHPINLSQAVRASSFYLKANHPLNEIGKYVLLSEDKIHWRQSKSLLKVENFDVDNHQKYEYGFRCMRELF